MRQSKTSEAYPNDFTGGMIKDALRRAADKLLIENLPAQRVLDEAQHEAQRALDAVLTPPVAEEQTTEEDAGELTVDDLKKMAEAGCENFNKMSAE
jgi:hypothetical protein